MLEFTLRRLVQSAVALLVMSVVVFVGIYAIGNPLYALVPPDASPQEVARLAAELGLDRPLWQQYGIFLADALTGQLGRSFVYNRPALDIILDRLPATLELATVALVLTVCIGVPLGLVAGLRPNGALDRSILVGSTAGVSLPSFFIGLLLIVLFSVEFGWFPSSGRGDLGRILGVTTSLATLDGWRHVALPALNMAVFNTALLVRITRAGTLQAMASEHVRFARASGLSEPRIVLVHVAKGMLAPVVTVLGLEFGTLIAFAVVTETIFGWPGMGKLLIDSINNLDRPVVVAYLLFAVAVIIAINYAVDLIHMLLDPRIRLQRAV